MTREQNSTQPITSGEFAALPQVDGYRLLSVLGKGGMSTVYLARQISLDREVALKVMLPEALTDEVSRRRFENEARTIARLDHPNIVTIYEVGRTRHGLPYYAMPYLPRGHLGQRQFAHDQPRVREILHDLLAALDYAHMRGVVHRDVKAENVLFDESGNPLLADFGIALRRGYGSRVTTAGLAVGSTAYMPPEQARGHNVDGRADLYSVGVLGWEMLTGRLPYNAGDALSMALQHAQEPIPKLPAELRHWQRFFDKALSKTPEGRFANAKEMRAALDRVPERASRSLLPSLPRGFRRAAWAGLAVLALATIAAWWWLWRTPESSAPAADTTIATVTPSTPAAPMIDGSANVDATTSSGIGSNSASPDPMDVLMRPLPQSPAEALTATARTQIQQQRWTTPEGDNAYDTLVSAARLDPAHPQLAPLATTLVQALAKQSVAAAEEGDLAATTKAAERATQLPPDLALPATTAAPLQQAVATMHRDVETALRARVQALIFAGQRKEAALTARTAQRLNLDAGQPSALLSSTRVQSRQAESVRPGRGWTAMRVAQRRVAIADAAVSRTEFARFADATGRTSARCRERGSLLRIVAPRDWKSPGFPQDPNQPVVCASWQDATAYAQWRGRQDGHRYRLATAAELHAAPLRATRSVAIWSDACAGQGCTRRVAVGTGWRGEGRDRALEPDRGYDDVGFRLARDL